MKQNEKLTATHLTYTIIAKVKLIGTQPTVSVVRITQCYDKQKNRKMANVTTKTDGCDVNNRKGIWSLNLCSNNY